MATFFYKARTKPGRLTSGLIEAADRPAAYQSLKRKALMVVSLRQTSVGLTSQPLAALERITLLDRINFTKQLGVMIKAGLPIVDALETIAGQTTKRKIKAMLSRIIQSVKAGSTLSATLKNEPAFFSDLYIAMVESGEKSGQLEEVLDRLGQNLEKDHEIMAKVKGALYYPIFILTVMTIVAFIIFSYVLPQLKSIFTDVGVPLPIMTRVLLAIGDFFGRFRVLVAGLAIGLLLLTKLSLRTAQARRIWDRIQLKIPVFGPFYRQIYNERFSRTLSSLVSAGLPMLDILKTCQRVMINHLYQEVVGSIIKEVESGTALSEALKHQRRFPQLIGNMVAVGEKTGNIPKVVGEIASYYQREIDQSAKNFTTLLEPFIMVVIGVGVGFMVAAVIVPIYNLISAA